MKRKVEVTLLGQRFTIRSEKDEAYVHSLVSYVSRKFEEVKRTSRTTSRDTIALLVALNLADELFQSVERAASSRDEVRRHSDALMQKLASALAMVHAREEEEDNVTHEPVDDVAVVCASDATAAPGARRA